MGRELILAVAGSGKTTYLIDQLDLSRQFLLITYTDTNEAHLRLAIIKKFGYVPGNILILTYFKYLLRICYRPFLKDAFQAKGICWEMPPAYTLRLKRNKRDFYLTRDGYLYHNRIAKLCLDVCSDQIKERLDKFFDVIMFDEVQDLAGHDFNLITSTIPANVECLFVGDFFQHTYKTSIDGNVNKNLFKNQQDYIRVWEKNKFHVDKDTLINSHRCSPTVCKFVRDKLKISIFSNRADEVVIKTIKTQEEADIIYHDDSIIKLFYDEYSKYDCYGLNWGISKGLDDFEDICIVLNRKTYQLFVNDKLDVLNPLTRNKLYVACTRARNNVYFLSEEYIVEYKKKND